MHFPGKMRGIAGRANRNAFRTLLEAYVTLLEADVTRVTSGAKMAARVQHGGGRSRTPPSIRESLTYHTCMYLEITWGSVAWSQNGRQDLKWRRCSSTSSSTCQ